MDIFCEQSAILVKKLNTELGNDSFNVFPYVTLCTLDIVCGKFLFSNLIIIFESHISMFYLSGLFLTVTLSEFMDFLSSRSRSHLRCFFLQSMECKFYYFFFFFFFIETAMGQHVNAQGNKDSDYVKAVYEYEFFL